MSAAEIIEQIKALPTDEKRKVTEFIRELDAKGPEMVHYISRDRAREASARIFEKHDELFRKLAQ